MLLSCGSPYFIPFHWRPRSPHASQYLVRTRTSAPHRLRNLRELFSTWAGTGTGTASSTPSSSTSETLAASTTLAASAFTHRPPTTRPTHGPVTTLLPRLDRDPEISKHDEQTPPAKQKVHVPQGTNVSPAFDPYTTLAALGLRQRRNDCFPRSVQVQELEERTRLGAYDLKVLHLTEMRIKVISQQGRGNGLDDALQISVRTKDEREEREINLDETLRGRHVERRDEVGMLPLLTSGTTLCGSTRTGGRARGRLRGAGCGWSHLGRAPGVLRNG